MGKKNNFTICVTRNFYLEKQWIGESIHKNLQDHIVEMKENRFFSIHEETIEKPARIRLLETLGRTSIKTEKS